MSPFSASIFLGATITLTAWTCAAQEPTASPDSQKTKAGSSAEPAGAIKMQQGELSVPEKVQLLSGELTTLRPNGSDKAVLLYVWTTYDGSLQDDLEIIQPLVKKYKSQGLKLIMLNCWESDDEIKKFAAENKLNYTIATDHKRVIAKKLHIESMPRLYVIDKDGIARWSRTGPLSGVDIESSINEVTSK